MEAFNRVATALALFVMPQIANWWDFGGQYTVTAFVIGGALVLLYGETNFAGNQIVKANEMIRDLS